MLNSRHLLTCKLDIELPRHENIWLQYEVSSFYLYQYEVDAENIREIEALKERRNCFMVGIKNRQSNSTLI